MCGISGFFNAQNVHLPFSILEMNTRLLNHRGPDHTGYYHDGPLGFAHNRLSLLDLSPHGNQPFENERGILIYSGEIYNHRALRQKVENQHRIRFQSTSDTEVLFQLLNCEGIEQTLPQLEGMFAFAYYDKAQRQLFLGRDRLGIKPLFYALEHDTLYFASEYKAILPHIKPELDEARALYSVFGILDKAQDYTIFKNISHLAPGQYLQFGRQGCSITRYFQLTDLIAPALYRELDKMPRQQVCGHFETRLQASVQKMLMSDAPMGAFVSGGVDSSLIASFASKNGPLDLFSANVVGKFSEIEDARRLSQTIHCPIHEYDFQPGDFIRDLVRCTVHMEIPVVVHTNAVPFMGVAQLAHNTGVKAVLTGEGADELFLGYPRLLTRRYDALIKWPLNTLKKLYQNIPALGRYALNTSENKLAGTLEMAIQKYQRQTLRTAELNRLHHIPEKERSDAYLSFQMVHEGLAALLWRNDRMGMAASIEARFPFLDEAMLTFALNLPVKHKIGRSAKWHNYKHPFLVDKYVVRKTAENHIPRRLAYKVKNGFPMYGYQYLEIDKHFFRDGFLANLLKMTAQQSDFFAQNTDRYQLAKFMALEVWAKMFLYGASEASVTESLHHTLRFKTTNAAHRPAD